MTAQAGLRPAPVPLASAGRIAGDDRLVADAGAVAAVLGLAVGLHPLTGSFVDGPGILEMDCVGPGSAANR